VICPTVHINFLCLNYLSVIFSGKPLTGFDCCFISSWSSFHLFRSDQRRCDRFWFFWFIILISILRNLKIILYRCDLLSWLFFYFLRQFLLKSSFDLLFFDDSLLNFLSTFSIRFCRLFKFFSYLWSFLCWRFFFLKLRISLVDWRLSFSDRWFHGSFTLETFDNFF